MADSDNLYLYQLTEDTDLGSTDILYAVVDPGGSPFDRFFEAGNEFARFKVTTAGDLLYGSGAATLARLGIGTSDQFLVVSAGLPAWTGLDISLDTTPQLGGNLDMNDKQAYNSVQAVTFASDGTTVDFDAGALAEVTLTDNVTITFTNARAGGSYALRVVQDGTGGRVVTWDTDLVWPLGSAPTLTTDAGAVDIISMMSWDGTTIYAIANLNFS